MTSSHPAVTIGMPVYNGEQTLPAALNSILSQTFTAFELVISDNASSDATESICRDYAARDRRIRYVRQEKNLGAAANFRYVLDEARGEYFMWAASDDIRSADFITLYLDYLESHPEYVASTSPVRFEGREFDEQKMGDRRLDDDLFYHRLRRFFGQWHANGAYYSLIRTANIKGCKYVGAGSDFLGSDWAIVLYLARQGKLNRLECGWVELGLNGVSNSGNIFRRYRFGLMDDVAPFWKLTGAAFSLSEGAPLRSRLAILYSCLIMNSRALKLQVVAKLYQLYKATQRLKPRL
ncbi:MAG: glycosyltransferase family 2 protein [Betaproteobacteria bacterium]